MKKENKKILKPLIISVIITAALLAIICPIFVFGFKHQPFLLHQTEVLFEDSYGDLFFSLIGEDGLKKYNYDSKNHFENYAYKSGETNFNCEQAASNSQYIFVALEHFSNETYGIIKVFNKSFKEIKTIEFGNYITVKGLACTEKSLYYVLKNVSTNKCSLFKFDIDTGNHKELVSDLISTDSYKDEEVNLFFTDLFRIQKKTERTVLVCKRNQAGNGWYFTDGDIRLEMNRNAIIVQGNDFRSLFNITNNSFNCFYDKVLLIDNHLLFAAYKRENNFKCGYAKDPTQCICGMKKSYLFDFDLLTNTFCLVKEFDAGTFLIDYDLSSAKYYYRGALYVGVKQRKECERVDKTKEKFVGVFGHWDSPTVDYYLSYYNEKFYGI